MAYNITIPKQTIGMIPKEFQESYEILLNKYKFPVGSFFGNQKVGKSVYDIKISETVLNKEEEKVLTGGGKKFTVTFIPSRLKGTPTRAAKVDNTTLQECMQCLYSSLRFKRGGELTKKNCKEVNITHKDITSKCFFSGTTPVTPQVALEIYSAVENNENLNKEWLVPDSSGQNVFMKIANAIYNHSSTSKFKGKTIYFHRGSSFMKAIYQSKKQTSDTEKKSDPQGTKVWTTTTIANDKWNPGDIWISTLNPNPEASHPFCYKEKNGDCDTYDMLKDSVRQHAIDGKILGISLKKTGKGPARVTEYNKEERKHNRRVTISNFSFGKTGNFFSSKDLYLNFSNGSPLQLKPGEIKSRWRGEIVGGTARGGNVAAPILNFFCEKFLKRSIGSNSITSGTWHENKFYNVDKSKVFRLYNKYSNHTNNKFKKPTKMSSKTFIETADKVEKSGSGFYFSKYMGLLFLDAFFGGSGNQTMCSTKIIRYAMSNLDVSSYYIKVN